MIPRATARGFTLIEVLAALVIVALGMLGVIEAVTQSARNGTYLRDKTLAHWVALNVITERRLQATPPPVAETADDVEFAGQRWHWTLRVTQTQVQSLRRMDVSVRPSEAPESSALATVAGFYGTAVGAAGGGSIDWNGSQGPGGGSDETNDDGTNQGGSDGKVKPGEPTAPDSGTPPPSRRPTDDEE
jgi:general secretion pathway protein I